MRASTELMDAEACAKVLGELERLQNAVQTDTFQGDATTLRAIVECPFPLAFLDMLQTIDAFADKPLLEAVAACVAIENRIAEGQPATADSGGGMLETSRGKLNVPDGPEFWACAMNRPIVPKMQRFPMLPPGFGMKDWVWDARK